LGEKLRFLGNLALDDTYRKIAQSEACMLFLTDDLAYSRSTKFYEYIAMKKPVLVMSPGGETGNYVAESKLGYDCKEAVMLQEVTRALEEIENGVFQFPSDYDVHAHDVMHLTDTIIERLLEHA